MMAGSGIWHRGRAFSQVPMRGFQIWFCMPPSHELDKPCAQFIQPNEVPTLRPVKLLLGYYSVHSCGEALFKGEEGIQAIGE